MNDVVPEDGKTPLNMYKVIERLVDAGEWLEVQKILQRIWLLVLLALMVSL